MGPNGTTDQRLDYSNSIKAARGAGFVYSAGELNLGRVREILLNDLELLVRLYHQMSAEKQREFWQLRCGRADKILYLMRWGGLEGGKPIALCS